MATLLSPADLAASVCPASTRRAARPASKTHTIVIGHFLLEILESIGETSLDDLKINPDTGDGLYVADYTNAAKGGGHE